MIWIALALLTLAALAPAALALRGRGRLRGRQSSAMDLHRAQLAELDRDLAEGRIGASDHATALLEVQRRLLAASATADPALAMGKREPLVLTLLVVPVLAMCLYLVSGRPDMPSATPEPRQATGAAGQDEANMIEQLTAAIAAAEPGSDRARDGNMLLGNIKEATGDFAGAAAAWRVALGIRFDPMLAAQAAEASAQAEGTVSPSTAALFRRALAAAPPDAPWRALVEQRLKEVVTR